MFGLKFPKLLNWIKLRPGIWDSGAISSTDWGTACDRAPTWGCLGLAPSKGSKQCGMDILPIFLLRFGSSLLMWIAYLASLVIWEGSLSIMLKSKMEGSGWWKSLQCLSMAAGCWFGVFLDPFTKGPGSFPNVGWFTPHLPCIPSGRLNPSFGRWRFCPLGPLAGIWECWPLWNKPVLEYT